MRRIGGTILIAVLAALVHAGFFAVLPGPTSMIHLPLILILSFVMTFRFSAAVISAIASGATLDLLSSGMPGANIFIITASTLLLVPLFTRIFTTRSIPGFLGINATAFLILHMLVLFTRTVRFWLSAYPISDLLLWTHIPNFLAGLVMHLATALILLHIFRAARSSLGSILMVR